MAQDKTDEVIVISSCAFMTEDETAEHILQNARVTSNKMVHRKIHHFLAQFSMPFPRFVESVSFKNRWIEASDWPVKNFNQAEGGFLS